jgi:hypothetical protein
MHLTEADCCREQIVVKECEVGRAARRDVQLARWKMTELMYMYLRIMFGVS